MGVARAELGSSSRVPLYVYTVRSARSRWKSHGSVNRRECRLSHASVFCYRYLHCVLSFSRESLFQLRSYSDVKVYTRRQRLSADRRILSPCRLHFYLCERTRPMPSFSSQTRRFYLFSSHSRNSHSFAGAALALDSFTFMTAYSWNKFNVFARQLKRNYSNWPSSAVAAHQVCLSSGCKVRAFNFHYLRFLYTLCA